MPSARVMQDEYGLRYKLFILQAKFSLTQVFNRPMTGRIFFEQLIRDNLDIGLMGLVEQVAYSRASQSTATE